MSKLGYQIPNFTYPNTVNDEIFGKVIAQAKAAEDAGFDRVFAMDHFYQLPGIGEPHEPMFECYTLLSALAQHTEKVRLSALVTGNTYRHPRCSPRRSLRSITSLAVVPPSESDPDGSSSNTTPSAMSSTPSPSDSRSSKKHCRSSDRCSEARRSVSTASTTRSRTW